MVAGAVWKLLGEGLLSSTSVSPTSSRSSDRTARMSSPSNRCSPTQQASRSRRSDIRRCSSGRSGSRPSRDGVSTGSRAASSSSTSPARAWVIAELVERRTGLPFADYLRSEIVEPLGLGFVLPVPEDRFDEIVAVPVAIDRTSDDQQVDPWGPWYLANAPVLAAGEPSHSIAGSAGRRRSVLPSISALRRLGGGRRRRRHHPTGLAGAGRASSSTAAVPRSPTSRCSAQ